MGIAVVAAEGAVEREQPAPRVGIQLVGGGVGLEPALVVMGPDAEVEGGEDVHGTRRQERHAHPDDAPHQIRTEQRGVPRDGRPPVVADEHCPRRAQGTDERDDVAHQVEHRVVGHVVGRRGRTEAALIGRDHVEPGLGQRLHLVAPRVRRLRKPVEEHHERPPVTGADLDDPHRHAVQLQVPPLHRRRLGGPARRRAVASAFASLADAATPGPVCRRRGHGPPPRRPV